jgi:hypothetical protein
MSTGHDEIRASVLEAALDLGVESPTFTEWMEGSRLSFAGAPLADKDSHMNSAVPFNASPGDFGHPYNSHATSQIVSGY